MRPLLIIGSLLVMTGVVSAGEKKLMHCFAFTPIKAATPADWKAFQAATDALPKKMPGVVSRVWHGKLRSPLGQFSVDDATGKKLRAGEKNVQGTTNRDAREYGVCMEMADAAALKTYDAHPAHKEWVDVYSKVRVEGTTTFDIIGQ
jgi:hypothetical protein